MGIEINRIQQNINYTDVQIDVNNNLLEILDFCQRSSFLFLKNNLFFSFRLYHIHNCKTYFELLIKLPLLDLDKRQIMKKKSYSFVGAAQ